MPSDNCLNAKIEIKEAYSIEERLTISARVVCDYSSLVRSPKISAVFSVGNETRILPFLVTSYFPHEDLKTCSIIAQYTYEIDYLFSENYDGENISLHFELDYGESYIPDLKLEYLVDTYLGDEMYEIKAKEDINCLDFCKSSKCISSKTHSVLAIKFKQLFSSVYNFIVRVFGYILIPFLLIDALMAKLNLTGYNQKISSREGIFFFADHVRLRFKAITKQDIGRGISKRYLATLAMHMYSKSKVIPNRVTFLSNRRDDLSGNFEYIYNILKEDESLDIQMLLDSTPPHRATNKHIIKFAKLYSTSAVVIVDDFFELTSIVRKKKDVKLIQVWHACGAFKTFGFSRLGKPGGPKQSTSHHRCYDYAVVSSENIRRYYSEGFGISLEKVVATGVPRTDIFFDKKYKIQKQAEFYQQYPQLKGKKIMLFAPTFRGNGKLTGSYPVKKFDLKTIYEQTNGEYAIIVKLHPFISDRFTIPKEYKDSIFDFSENSELNDLLFVTDLLVTDYSSVVFEASLLNVPMLFYAFDLNEYIASRDFYCEYKSFLPGKIAYDIPDFLKAVKENDFETEKIEAFRNKFFDEQDGQSAMRVAKLVNEIVNQQK
ncbi:MAG: CDP-glycerol glycerophosphotransferase family protein [Oscillospiraceae bacterium]